MDIALSHALVEVERHVVHELAIVDVLEHGLSVIARLSFVLDTAY